MRCFNTTGQLMTRRCGKVGTHVILVNNIAFIRIAASIPNAWTSASRSQLEGCTHCS